MPRDNQIGGIDRARGFLFVGSCAAIFLILAACAVYAVVTLAI
jgi:hypothetical protein